ncbi:hypothetical protein FQN60_013052, partial [Etheostoma spectabile]
LLLHFGLQVSEGAPVCWSPAHGAGRAHTLSPLTVDAWRDGWVSHLWFILQPNKSGQSFHRKWRPNTTGPVRGGADSGHVCSEYT